MTEHPSAITIERLAIGALDDEAVVAHCSACDACAERLSREARLELALGELHVFRRAAPRRGPLVLGVAAALLAAAAVLLAVRGAPAPARPDVRAEPVVAAASSEPPPGADAVIAGLRPQLRRCFQEGLARSSAPDGRVVLRAEIEPDGAVRDVSIASNVGLPDEVVTCMARVLGAARFTPTGDRRTLHVPVSFVSQR